MPTLPRVGCFIQRGWKTLSPEFQFCLCHPLAVGLWTSHLTTLCDLGNKRLAHPSLGWCEAVGGKVLGTIMVKLQVEMAALFVLV